MMRSITLLLLTLSCSPSPDENTSPPPQDEVAIDDRATSTEETAEPDEVCPYPTDTVELASASQKPFDAYSADTMIPLSRGSLYWQLGTIMPDVWLTLRGTDLERAAGDRAPSSGALGEAIRYSVELESPGLWEGAFQPNHGFRFRYAGPVEVPQPLTLLPAGMPVADVPQHFTLFDDDTWCTYPVMVTFSWQDEHRPACHGEAVYDVMMQPAQGQVCPYVTPGPSEPVIVVPGGDTADIPP